MMLKEIELKYHYSYEDGLTMLSYEIKIGGSDIPAKMKGRGIACIIKKEGSQFEVVQLYAYSTETERKNIENVLTDKRHDQKMRRINEELSYIQGDILNLIISDKSQRLRLLFI